MPPSRARDADDTPASPNILITRENKHPSNNDKKKGIARLPVDELRECGITYAFTNCRQDSYTYPILHDRRRRRPDKLEDAIASAGGGGGGGGEAGTDDDDREERIVCSQHLEASCSLFADVRRRNAARRRDEGRPRAGGGCVLFFCVAGQNRSAALAAATMMIHGMPLEGILGHCARQRPFVLENVGFQRQLVELEAIVDSLTRGGGGRRSALAIDSGVIGISCAPLDRRPELSNRSGFGRRTGGAATTRTRERRCGRRRCEASRITRSWRGRRSRSSY